MATGSILLGVALLLLVALYVGRPFLLNHNARRESLGQREALELQKEALLEQIRLLDFEYETGKMPQEEHGQQRTRLLYEAAAVLKALDNLAPAGPTNGAPAAVDADIEKAIAALRRPVADPGNQPLGAAAANEAGAQIEAAIQQRRADSGDGPGSAARPAGQFCAQCGKPRDPADKFCAFCGNRFV